MRKKAQRLNIPDHEHFPSDRIRIIMISAFRRRKLNMK